MRRVVYAARALTHVLGPVVALMIFLMVFVGLFFVVAALVSWVLGATFDSVMAVLVILLALFGFGSIGLDMLREFRTEYRRLKEVDEVQAIDEALQKQRKDSIL